MKIEIRPSAKDWAPVPNPIARSIFVLRYERILNIILYNSVMKRNATNIRRKILHVCWKRVELKLQAFLYTDRAQPLARGQHFSSNTVLHSPRKHLISGKPFNHFPAKAERERRRIFWKILSCWFTDSYIMSLIHFIFKNVLKMTP